MGSVTPLNSKQYTGANTTTTSDDRNASDHLPVPIIDNDSFSLLRETCSELREFYELERCPGRASWLSEILEDIETLITRLKPSQAQE